VLHQTVAVNTSASILKSVITANVTTDMCLGSIISPVMVLLQCHFCSYYVKIANRCFIWQILRVTLETLMIDGSVISVL